MTHDSRAWRSAAGVRRAGVGLALVASLAATALLIALWARANGVRGGDSWVVQHAARGSVATYVLHVRSGGVLASRHARPDDAGDLPRWYVRHDRADDGAFPAPTSGHLGFGWDSQGDALFDNAGRSVGEDVYQRAIVPIGATLALAIAPLAVFAASRAVRRHARQRRIATGRCPACGYDLQGTPNRCPECGRPTPGD